MIRVCCAAACAAPMTAMAGERDAVVPNLRALLAADGIARTARQPEIRSAANRDFRADCLSRAGTGVRTLSAISLQGQLRLTCGLLDAELRARPSCGISPRWIPAPTRPVRAVAPGARVRRFRSSQIAFPAARRSAPCWCCGSLTGRPTGRSALAGAASPPTLLWQVLPGN